MGDKDQAEKQKAERDKPVSLAPLNPKAAMRALLGVNATDKEHDEEVSSSG